MDFRIAIVDDDGRDRAALVAGDARFLDINRGVVVNMDHVAAVKDASALMSDGRSLPLRKRRPRRRGGAL